MRWSWPRHGRLRRVELEWNWWPINRPRLSIYAWNGLDRHDNPVAWSWVYLSWGNGNSDPVWSISVRATGRLHRLLARWAQN